MSRTERISVFPTIFLSLTKYYSARNWADYKFEKFLTIMNNMTFKNSCWWTYQTFQSTFPSLDWYSKAEVQRRHQVFLMKKKQFANIDYFNTGDSNDRISIIEALNSDTIFSEVNMKLDFWYNSSEDLDIPSVPLKLSNHWIWHCFTSKKVHLRFVVRKIESPPTTSRSNVSSVNIQNPSKSSASGQLLGILFQPN